MPPSGRSRLHPPGDADHRRYSGCRPSRQHLGFVYSCRSPASPARRHPIRAGCRARSPASSATPTCRSRSVSACGPPSTRVLAAGGADGVVVGSALVDVARQSLDPTARPRRAPSGRSPTWSRNSPPACASDWTPSGGIEALRSAPIDGDAAWRTTRHGARGATSHELAHQRRPAEDPLAAAPRGAGEPVGEMPGNRADGLLQGPRGEPVRHSRLQLPHAHERNRAAQVAVRRRDLFDIGVSRGAGRSPEIPRRAPLCRSASRTRAPRPA